MGPDVVMSAQDEAPESSRSSPGTSADRRTEREVDSEMKFKAEAEKHNPEDSRVDQSPARVATGDLPEPTPFVLVPDSLADDFNPAKLKLYYKWLFPYKEMYTWLSYGHAKKNGQGSDGGASFVRREFSFTLENDIYVRFQCFKDLADMESRIMQKCPHKIDIGAVYSTSMELRNSLQGGGGFFPVERELVFDIDMSDYDDVRSCCSGARVCPLCWHLMTVAIKVLDRVLREDFGFEHLLWVFSGRRGVHCWVCDSRARRLTDEQRSAIADYLTLYKGNEADSEKVTFRFGHLHPTLRRAYEDVLSFYFKTKIVPEQGLLGTPAAWASLLEAIPDAEMRKRLDDAWKMDNRGAGEDASCKRWSDLEKTVRHGSKKVQSHVNPLRATVEAIVFGHVYPRLDREVSKRRNHLLKAPFCVHPKTGKVCVPIDPEKCEEFNPEAVPTLSQLMQELNAGSSEGSDPSAECTSMLPYLNYFRTTFLGKLLPDCKEELKHEQLAESRKKRRDGGIDF